MTQFPPCVSRHVTTGLLLALLLFTAALVWHDLGVREVLGRDENATITKLDQPNLKAVLDVTYVKNTGEPGYMQPLYFLVQYLFRPAIGRSAFMLRFLPSIFGLLVVLLTYKLGEALLGSVPALVGALLTALLPLHIRYAQIARPYTLLAVFSLASAYLVVKAVKTNRPSTWAGFVLTATLGFHTHYNSLFVLAAEGLLAGIAWLTIFLATGKQQRTPGQLKPVLSFVAVAILCLPGLIRLSRLPLQGLEEELEAEGREIVTLTIPFFRHFLYESGLVTRWLQNLIAALVILGVAATLFRRRWQAALFAVLWLGVPFVTLAVINSPHRFEERYLIFVPPMVLLLAGQAVVAGSGWLAVLGQRWNEQGARLVITLFCTVGLAWILAGRVCAYFASNREADRLDQALTVVEHNARPGDIIVVSPRFFLRPLAVEDIEVFYLTRHLSFEELNALVSREGRMWVLYTSYPLAVRLQEPLDQWLQARSQQFIRIPIKTHALAFEIVSHADAESELRARITALEELAHCSAGQSEAWYRYNLLADAYQELASLYADRGQDILAAQCTQKAEEIRTAHSPP
ncbi:MAG: glycosyltransferase family 39 protein [Anaerolineae bacterium]